jgi:hypothetical protein
MQLSIRYILSFFLMSSGYPATRHIYVLARTGRSTTHRWRLDLLVDPVEGSGLVADGLTILEPEGNLLLGVLDGVGAVADVAADIDGEVTTDGARGGGEGVGGTEDDCSTVSAVGGILKEGSFVITYRGRS